MEPLPLKFQAVKEIAELSPEGVFVYDINNESISYSNPLASELLNVREGASPSEIKSIFESIVPDDREYLKSVYLQAIKTWTTRQVEFRMSDRNNKIVVVCCTAYVLAADSKIVVFVRDITQAKTHEDYLVEFGARKNTVLDILTHHLSGALNLMKHLSGEASKYVDETADKNLKVFLELLDRNNEHCIELINDLLKNEHERSPHVDIKCSRIDIVNKISLVYDEFRHSYSKRIFHFTHSVETFFINTDEVKLLQIMNNLISNAIKFSKNDQPISIALSETTSDIIISIKDHGIGIPESLIPFIFDRQSIAGRTGLNGEKSMGFGLSICKNLIKLLQGKIWFETQEGEGTTFYFSLPKEL